MNEQETETRDHAATRLCQAATQFVHSTRESYPRDQIEQAEKALYTAAIAYAAVTSTSVMLSKVSGMSTDRAAASLREAASRFVHWSETPPHERRKLAEALLYAAAHTYAITARRASDRYL